MSGDSLSVQRQSATDYFGAKTATAGNGTTTVPTFVVAQDNNVMLAALAIVAIIALIVALILVLTYMKK